MIAAANHIRNRPYVWGGGHRSFNSRGYDCSGSVSYVLHAAGLLDYPDVAAASSATAAAGAAPGCGSTPATRHVFMVIAGLRWDTSYITDGDRTGPGWSRGDAPDRRLSPAPPVGVLKAG